MRHNFIFLPGIAFILGLLNVQAQENKEGQNWGIHFSGYVKHDAFYDTRQTIAVREGHFLLWPDSESLDANGEDVNAKANFNMLSVQSRLSGTITGPDAFGAKTSGKIEGDFFAQKNDNINLFRLRHAFVKLDWGSTNLLFGQYWNPLFVTACFPGTVSFNTGTPFQPFARNPQIRLSKKFGDIQLIAAALSQRDYPSRAPTKTSTYLRNSAIPDMHLQLHYVKSVLNTGAGIAYKTIVPRLVTDQNIKTTEGVSGLTAIAFAKIKLDPVTIKVEGISGQNIPDVLQASGFAVTSIDTTTDKRTYSPIQNLSLWTDIHTNGKNIQFGVFAGYSVNQGTKDEMHESNIIYGLGTSIKSLMRISPRIVINSGKTRFALETEYTSAEFGADYSDHAIPEDIHKTSNIRILFSTYYFF